MVILLLVACAMGPSEETLLTDLRVVAAVAEPPEVAPGEETTIEVTVADPSGAGAEVLVWTPAGRFAGDLVDQRVTGTLPVSDEVGAAPLWVLACEPGLCPMIRDEGFDLSDPDEWIAELPMEGVSLATRAFPVSRERTRNANPVVTVTGDLASSAGAEVELDVDVVDEDETTVVFGYTTGGGFGMASFPVVGGASILTWYAPEEEGPVDLFVVVQDDRGGAAVWRGEATVR